MALVNQSLFQPPAQALSMRDYLKAHRPEYLLEAGELGVFMISATLFTVLLYHPASPAVRAIPAEFTRRVLIGLAMGLTLVGIVFSPWGKQSGAHMNPAFTLTFYRLGKVAPWDAVFYVIAQFVGGVAGVAIVAIFAGNLLAHPTVNYAPKALNQRIACAKYHHQNNKRCIFCEFQAGQKSL
jgi:aquaporin Z